MTVTSRQNSTTLQFGNNTLTFDLSRGAAITHLCFEQNGRAVEVLKPHESIAEENPWLFPWPNRLKNGHFNFEGKSHQFPHNDYGRPNALHGFVKDHLFTLSDQGQDADKAWVEVVYEDAGKLESYPFPFKLSFRYTLTTLALNIDVHVTNTGAGKMPAGLGWHPYFCLPSGKANALMKLPACQEIEVNDILLPTGKKWPSTSFDGYRSLDGVDLDTCFELNLKGQSNSVFLKARDDYELELWQDGDHHFVQVYTPQDGQTIAIEPMTCGIDALNNGQGLKVLDSGESWALSCGVKLL